MTVQRNCNFGKWKNCQLLKLYMSASVFFCAENDLLLWNNDANSPVTDVRAPNTDKGCSVYLWHINGICRWAKSIVSSPSRRGIMISDAHTCKRSAGTACTTLATIVNFVHAQILMLRNCSSNDICFTSNDKVHDCTRLPLKRHNVPNMVQNQSSCCCCRACNKSTRVVWD